MFGGAGSVAEIGRNGRFFALKMGSKRAKNACFACYFALFSSLERVEWRAKGAKRSEEREKTLAKLDAEQRPYRTWAQRLERKGG